MFPILALSLAVIAGSSQQSSQPDPIDRVIGAWSGEAEHAGETSPVILEFIRSGERVLAVASLPAIHAWRFPIAVVTMTANRISGAGITLDFDPDAATLTTTIPSELVPKYRMPVVLRKRGEVVPPARPPIAAPSREPAWTRTLGAPSWADVSVIGDLVVVGDDAGRLHAFGQDGKERWTFTAGGAIRAGAVAVEHDVVVQADDGVLYRIDTANGQARWRVTIAKPTPRVGIGDPASRYENRASAVAVDGDRLLVGTHDGRVLALDARSGAEVWSFAAGDAVVAAPVVARGKVYCGSFDGFVYALDRRSGALAWKHDTGGAVTSDVAVTGDRVLAGSRSYDFEALDADTGRPTWTRYFWFSWVESSATVDGSTAYVGSSDAAKVFAIDRSSGRVLWSADAGGSAWGRPAVRGDVVYEGVAGVTHYIAAHAGSVVAFDRASGRPLWRYPFEAAPASSSTTSAAYGVAGSVAVGAKHVFAASVDGRLLAFVR